MANVETVRLGDEHDDDLWAALSAVLREMSARKESTDRALAGSQEIDSFQVDVGGRPLVVESETYIGLSITGEPALVQEVQKRVAARMKAGGAAPGP